MHAILITLVWYRDLRDNKSNKDNYFPSFNLREFLENVINFFTQEFNFTNTTGMTPNTTKAAIRRKDQSVAIGWGA